MVKEKKTRRAKRQYIKRDKNTMPAVSQADKEEKTEAITELPAAVTPEIAVGAKVEEQPVIAQVAKPDEQPMRTKSLHPGWWRWKYLLIIPALLLIVGGFLSASVWGSNREATLFAYGIVGIPIGAFLVYWVFRHTEDQVVIVLEGGLEQQGRFGKKWGKANSLNIYAQKDSSGRVYPDKIAFEWVDKPLGQPQQCINNGERYFVHLYDIATKVLNPFILPDSQYYDPAEFANVIRMPAHRRLFTQQASLFQKVAIGAMVLVSVILGVVLIALPPK